MLAVKTESDDDGYCPSGLLGSADNALDKGSIKTNEIFEFYNINKSTSGVIEKSSRESDVFVDLSGKVNRPGASCNQVTSLSSVPKPPVSASPPVSSSHRVLTIQPGSHHPQLPTDVPKSSSLSSRPYVSQTIQYSPMRPGMYRPFQMPISVPTLFPFNGNTMYHSQRPSLSSPYLSPGLPPIKLPLLPHTSSNTPLVPQQTLINPNTGMYTQAYMAPIHPQMSSMGPMFHPGMILLSHVPPMMQLPTPPPPLVRKPLPSIMPPPESKPKITSEVRKKLREEAAAKLKAERDARKAQIRAQKAAEKAKTVALKKKRDAMIAETGQRKFGTFSKDMFVIRLKDVDSFNRNNEVWRIDNHVLIQKFCGVPSLRAPARQFQSTNRLSGYDSRATWRLFIINPDNVEVDKYGGEVTIRDFPSITVLREAKQLAEMKDGAFKEIEKSEYKEKLLKLEQKKNSKLEAKMKRRLERRQNRLDQKLKHKNYCPKVSKQDLATSLAGNKVGDYPGYSAEHTTVSNDEYVCRDILNGLLDALDDEEYEEDDSFLSTDEESDFSDEEDENEEEHDDNEDAGSLFSLAHSSDNEENILYEEHELPAVALELVVD